MGQALSLVAWYNWKSLLKDPELLKALYSNTNTMKVAEYKINRLLCFLSGQISLGPDMMK